MAMAWPVMVGVGSVCPVSVEGFAAAVVREDGKWRCSLLAEELLEDLDGVITALRQVASPGAVFGMLAVDDEFFVLVRPVPGGAALLLSDATAGLDYDVAADVLDLLQVPIPDEDDVEDDDPWPDEQLALIAQRCGFADEFARAIEKS